MYTLVCKLHQMKSHIEQDVYRDKDGERPPIFKLISWPNHVSVKAARHRLGSILYVLLLIRRPCCKFYCDPELSSTEPAILTLVDITETRARIGVGINSTTPNTLQHGIGDKRAV